MGLFDAFSASGSNKELKKGFNYQTGQNQLAQGALTSNYGNAINTQNQALPVAQNYLQSGADTAAGYQNQALAPWQNLSAIGNQGLQQYGDLVGLNGADMSSALAKIPGYQFAVDQATQGIDRNRAAQGMLASGNTDIDLANQINGIASQNYFNYAHLLDPYFGLAQNAASGQQGAYNNLSNIYNSLGQNQANLTTNTANNVSGLQSDLGAKQAGIYSNQGQVGNSYYTNRANADQQANANLWSAILGLGGAAASGIGMAV